MLKMTATRSESDAKEEEAAHASRLLSSSHKSKSRQTLEAFVTGPFSQQELWAWRPLLTPVAVAGLLLFVAVFFIPFGLALLDVSERNKYQRVRYDDRQPCEVSIDDTNGNLPKTCTFNFTLDYDMRAPVYVYYEIHSFYQNHRKYLDSKSDTQLRGKEDGSFDAECSPFEKWEDQKVYPCGMQARSFFSDRFSMSVNGEELCDTTSRCVMYGSNDSRWLQSWEKWSEGPNWSNNGVAWNTDVDEKFVYDKGMRNKSSRQGAFQEKQGLLLPDIENEDFIVWMRPAAFPTFRKLYRIINKKDLKKGDVISVNMAAWFPVNEFNGRKYVALATTTWAGLDNSALAWSLISLSLACIVISFVTAVMLLFGTRKLAVVDIFDWHNRPKTQALDYTE